MYRRDDPTFKRMIGEPMLVSIPDALWAGVERLAKAEGLSTDAFVVRSIEEAVGWTERTLDDVEPTKIRLDESERQTTEALKPRLVGVVPKIDRGSPAAEAERMMRDLARMRSALPRTSVGQTQE